METVPQGCRAITACLQKALKTISETTFTNLPLTLNSLLHLLVSACNCAKATVSPAPSSDQGQSPAGKAVYPGGPGTKITSVSTGNLCADVSDCSRPYVECSSRPDETGVTLTLEDTQHLEQRRGSFFSEQNYSDRLHTMCFLFSFGKVSQIFSFHSVVSVFFSSGRALPSPSRGLPHPHPDLPQGVLHHPGLQEPGSGCRPRAGALTALAGHGGQRAPPCGRQHPQQHAGRTADSNVKNVLRNSGNV